MKYFVYVINSEKHDKYYTSGTKSGETFVYCLDSEGNKVWEQPNGKAW